MSGKYALIIGNTKYIDSGLAQLTAPGKDAEDFARVLKDQEICSFNQVNILLNQLSSTVIEAIDEFFDQKKPDDLLVVYFSGHGVKDDVGSLYLAVTNTIRSRLRSTAIRSDYIREAMDQSRSKRQVLILDCCNSGAFPQGTKAEVGGMMGMVSALQGYGRFVLTASDATQFAWEGDKVIGETQNSLFTHFLVKGLEGEADSDGDGKISVDELYDYAYQQISRVTPKQTPTKSSSKVEGDIVLRQITRLEDIKPVSLPNELIEAAEDLRTFVREGAVQQLAKLLNGKNLGLARSAREALERIEKEDDSRRVSQAATQVLEPIRQAEQLKLQKAEEERLAAEKVEAQRLLAQQKAEEERKAREEAERLATLKAEEERLAREKAEEERIAKLVAERRAAEKVEADRKAKEETERLRAEQMAAEEQKARAKEAAEHNAKLKAALDEIDRKAAERSAREKAEREFAEKVKREAEYRAALDEIDRKAAERTAREKAEAERLAKQKVEEERVAQVKIKSDPGKVQQKTKLRPLIASSNKSPYLALLLSLFLFGGVGQIYLGQWKKGITWIIATLLSFSLFFSGLLIFFSLSLIGAIDAYRIAQKLRDGYPVREWELGGGWKGLLISTVLVTIFVILVIAVLSNY